jgi:subtilase family serine protease
MSRKSRFGWFAVAAFAFLFGTTVPVLAQTNGVARRLVTRNIDEHHLVRLSGNVRPEMKPGNDRGLASDDLQLRHMYLQLRRSSERQTAAEQLVQQLHDPQSPMYHKWLTADEVADRFGPSDDDVKAVTDWLTSHGFTVHGIYPANGVIDFSGSAGDIRKAFHTEIHNLSVGGKHHIANASDPMIPAALADAVQGVVSLNDFRPQPMLRPKKNFTIDQFTQALVPGDLQTIYNINPLYARGISGKGQTIAVLEDSDLFSTADWQTFRQKFGLNQKFPFGSLSQVHPQPSHNPFNGGACDDPGVNGNGGEAAVDVEWASAAAPNAAIVLASCADTETNFGGFIAMQNMLTGHGRPPEIISISFGESESFLGASFNAYINQLYQLGVLEGVSVFVSTGDAGAAASDQFESAAEGGINVSGFATTPNNVAVGGTDFADGFFGTNSTFWSGTNGPFFNSALSYVPEIPWSDSCASQLITLALGFTQSFGDGGSCNSTIGKDFFLSTAAGAGGPSACASGAPTIPGIVGGTCKGYKKPIYQKLVFGNPHDGVRDIPDVALFAGNGVWGHFYVICYSDPNFGGPPCTGDPSTWAGAGGTSFSSPIMAGIQALINQSSEKYQGNPNFVYYGLAALEYGFKGNGGCNSSLGNQTDDRCIFYDVTLGDNNVNCLPLVIGGTTIGTFNCFDPGSPGNNGVLSTSNTANQPAFVTAPGYDYPTGIGSVNAFNLVKHWPGSRLQ